MEGENGGINLMRPQIPLNIEIQKGRSLLREKVYSGERTFCAPCIELSDVQIIDDPSAFACSIRYEEESDSVIRIRKPKEGFLAGESFPAFRKTIVNHLNDAIAFRLLKKGEETGCTISLSILTRTFRLEDCSSPEVRNISEHQISHWLILQEKGNVLVIQIYGSC
jgi:hypothetical protein